MWKDFTSQLVIAAASFAAAGFWFWSASVDIADNLDTLITDIQWAARLSSWGAIAAGVAASVVFINFIREWKD